MNPPEMKVAVRYTISPIKPPSSTPWVRAKITVAMDKPVGSATLDGIVMVGSSFGIAIGLTAWVDVTHLPSGKKIASFRTLGAAMEFATVARTMEINWHHEELRYTNVEAAYLREIIGTLRETETQPKRL